MAKKLDLSRLSDEEAKHVWEVIQRDMELRKKEESRLVDLKTKIEKEGTKRELLTSQSSLTESHCIHCLQPFKFLVNSRRQCADCNLYTCKACSRYNKKERSWVCDPCRMSRVLKIGSLDWYHNNVRSRFKRFGSAKVMRSLYKRLNESGSQLDLRGPREYDTQSTPDVRYFYDGHEEEETPDVQRFQTVHYAFQAASTAKASTSMDKTHHSDTTANTVKPPVSKHFSHWFSLSSAATGMLVLTERKAEGAQEWKVMKEEQIQHANEHEMRKTKRLLSVHPLDFDMDQEYSAHSRRPSGQVLGEHSRQGKGSEYSTEMHFRYTRRKSLEKPMRSDEVHIPDQKMMRTRSLSKIGSSQRYAHGELDSSEEEEAERYPMYQLPARRRSRASSQENVHQGPPQMAELTKRMVAIESLLTRLEQKMVDPVDHIDSPMAVDLEEEKLSKKLRELTGNISDKGLSSEEEEAKLPKATKETMKKSRPEGEPALVSPLPQERVLSSSSDEQLSETQKRSSAAALCDITTEVLRTINATESALTELAPSEPNDTYHLMGTDVKQSDEAYRALEENVYLTAGKSYNLEKKLRSLEQSASNRYCGNTDSELSELEDKVALAAAKVQNTESEVSDIENRIAALSASGMSEKLKKKASATQRRGLTSDISAKTSNASGSRRKSSFM